MVTDITFALYTGPACRRCTVENWNRYCMGFFYSETISFITMGSIPFIDATPGLLTEIKSYQAFKL